MESYIDLAQLTLYAFWVFFFGLIYYLRSEDKREGYPLVLGPSDRQRRIRIQGFPPIPEPKTFLLHHGSITVPRGDPEGPIAARPVGPWPGAPYTPTGDPMRDGVGPAAYAMRAQEPELTLEGKIKMAPIRVATDYYVEPSDPDPRGMKVLGADGAVAGTVRDLWIDRSDGVIRYLEVDVPGTRGVLLPMALARVDGPRRRVRAASVLARHFAGAPQLAQPNQVTMREEDRICAYFASGHLYAVPSRLGPLL